VRTIPLDDTQVEALRDHRRRQQELRRFAAHLWEDNDLVFCTCHLTPPVSCGKPLDRRNVYRQWQRIVRSAGVSAATFHALRHTGLSGMAEDGVNPETIRQIAGHSDVRITLAWYTHPTDEMKRRAIEGLSGRYGSPRSAQARDEDEEDDIRKRAPDGG
jgi:integrase